MTVAITIAVVVCVITAGIFGFFAVKRLPLTGMMVASLFWVVASETFFRIHPFSLFRPPPTLWAVAGVVVLALAAFLMGGLLDGDPRLGWAYVPASLALVLAVCIGFAAIPAIADGATPPTVPPFHPTQKTSSQCSGYNVVLNTNAGNRVLSNGVTGTPQQVVNVVMQVAKHDPRVLALYYNATPSGKQSPIKDFHQLVDPATGNGCYSTEGVAIYNQTLGAFGSALSAGQVTTTTAPASGVNTGVTSGGGAPFQEQPGTISGNRAATAVTFLNGLTVYILHRCGNLVTLVPIQGVTVINIHQVVVVINKLPPPKVPPHHPPSTTTTTLPSTTTTTLPKCAPPNPYFYGGQCNKCPPGTGATKGGTIEQGGTPCGGGVNNPTTIQNPSSPGPTPGAPPQGGAESVVIAQQPAGSMAGAQGDTSGNTSTPYGTDTGSPQGGTEPVQSGGNNGDASGGSSQITATTTPPPDSGTASGSAGDPNAGGPP